MGGALLSVAMDTSQNNDDVIMLTVDVIIEMMSQ